MRAASLWAQIVGVQKAVVESVEFDEVDDALIISVRPVKGERVSVWSVSASMSGL